MLFTHSSFTKKGRDENLTASGEILVFRIVGECQVMWSKLDHRASEQNKTKHTEIWWEGKGCLFNSKSSNPPVSGQEACPKIWQP